jgi:hypothetical protein
MSKLVKLAKEIEKIAYELEVFGVQKEAASPKLFEYEYEGMKFYTDKKMPQGIRLPAGKAKFTKNYYTVSGSLAKDLKEGEDA